VYAEGNSAMWGGGLFVDAPPVTVLDSALVANRADVAGGGASADDLAGVWLGRVVFDGVELRDNVAPSGAGVDVYETELVLDGGAVEGNVADAGGGVYLWPGSSLTVTASDFGDGATDNAPDDVWTTIGYGGYGAGASFTCDVACTGP
ncbi:MAG: hypothetical protein ABMB14_38340, partial [Myxococcota bacterium]